MKKLLCYLLLCAMLMTLVCFVGCKSAEDDYEDGAASDNGADNIVTGETDRKIVYTVTLDLEAKNVGEQKNSITALCKELNGYVENSYESYNNGECSGATIILRIPTENLDSFVNQIEAGDSKITYKKVSTTDITTQYVDVVATKNALLERKAALEALLNDTATSASDKINIINEISKVNTELQANELLITQYDSKVNFSTVTMSITQASSLIDRLMPLIILVIIPAVVAAIVLSIIAAIKHKRKKNVKE